MRRIKRIVYASLALAVTGFLAAAIVYAGSPDTLARGVTIDGVDVGGLSSAEATTMLQQRSRVSLAKPVRFVADGHSFSISASELGLKPDWADAVAAARHEGDGFGPLRGLRRMKLRVFGGGDVFAGATYDTAALKALVAKIAAKVDRPHREAAVVFHGLTPAIVAGRAGRVLDREAAGKAIVAALASLSRGAKVTLPLEVDAPRVKPPMLARAKARARIAVSAPLVLTLGATHYRIPRWRIAGLLDLPANGDRKLRIGGAGADAYFKRLEQVVNKPAQDAQFVVVSGGITIKPSVDAQVLDVPKTADAMLAAMIRPAKRTAEIAVATHPAKRTTDDAKAMGITGIVGSYTTEYGGVQNRLDNVQLVAHLIDGAMIAPGKEFSFNGTTGERGADKGFKVAPVIINGELQNALGGGVCQVSTTVFNAAFEVRVCRSRRGRTTPSTSATTRRAGTRPSTIPDTDLKFVNDTGHWLLLRTFASTYSLTVNLYGTPQHRKVESTTSPLPATGPGPGEGGEGSDAAQGRAGRRPSRARRRSRRASPAASTTSTESSSPRAPGTRTTSATPRSSASGRSRSRSPSRRRSRLHLRAHTSRRARPDRHRTGRHDRDRHRPGGDDADGDRLARRRLGGGDRLRQPRRESAPAATSPRRPPRASSSRPRPPRRRARARTRTGSARPGRRRSARGCGSGRRSAPASGSERATPRQRLVSALLHER